MVKKLDDARRLDDHIGLDLWRAATSWRKRLQDEMIKRGHGWYGDARSAIAAHLEPGGLSQAELVRRMGMTKQAVQQLLDGLEADGIVVREADPADGRSRRVVYTKQGLAAVKDAILVKRTIEREYRRTLGDEHFGLLRASLRKLAGPPGRE